MSVDAQERYERVVNGNTLALGDGETQPNRQFDTRPHPRVRMSDDKRSNPSAPTVEYMDHACPGEYGGSSAAEYFIGWASRSA